MKKIILILALAAIAASCEKKHNTACYRCEHMRIVNGRGAIHTDTLCGMDDGQIKSYEAADYISNDSVNQNTSCSAL